ncbi:MAG: hypothetical protein WA133_05485, partial [Syntrophales bacterium]
MPGWRGWAVDRDEDTPLASQLQFLDKRHDLPREIGGVVHQGNRRPHRRSNGEPIACNDAGVGDSRRDGVGSKARAHGGRWFHIDNLAATHGKGERDSARTPADIDDDVFRFNIRGDNLQVRVERSTWIGLQKRVVGRETCKEIPRGLRTAQTGP